MVCRMPFGAAPNGVIWVFRPRDRHGWAAPGSRDQVIVSAPGNGRAMAGPSCDDLLAGGFVVRAGEAEGTAHRARAVGAGWRDVRPCDADHHRLILQVTGGGAL